MGISRVMVGDEVQLDLTGDSVVASALLKGYTAHGKDGELVEGEIPIKQAVERRISDRQQTIFIDPGYYSQMGRVAIDPEELQKITHSNIKLGVTILGVTGSYSGESAKVQAVKYATPGFEKQTVYPDEGFSSVGRVEIEAIPIERTENEFGGITVSIG